MTDLAQALEEARRGLLDLSTRNRLLSLPKPGRSRGVVVLDDEDADFLVKALREGQRFTFESVAGEVAPPPPAPPAGSGKPRRTARKAGKTEGVGVAATGASREEWQKDLKLRVRMAPEDLVRRLRDIIADAATAREESGIATLYLAIGALAWRDAGTPETERLAPLALMPVQLVRQGVSQVFTLSADAAEVAENLSLRELFSAQFKIDLPAFDAENYDPTLWAEAVAGAVAGRAGWHVAADSLALGLFSFAKFLMWRDLDPAANPGLLTHPLIRALVGGEPLEPGPGGFSDDADVDEAIPVERLDHVMDGDGSQALAIETVRRGGHLVIQGPPGTGKSQTITNIIAQAVLDGRSVLFVAEKLAALQVVQRRLAQVGLGAACLELHSEKQSKRAVLDELRATLAMPAVAKPDREAVVRRLGALRGRINRHAEAMRSEAGASGLPLHVVVGGLAALRARGVKAGSLTVSAGAWDAERIERNRAAVRELALRAVGAKSAFRGVGRDLTPSEVDRLMGRLPELIRAFATGAAALGGLATALGRGAPGPGDVEALRAASAALESVPAHDAAALGHAAWQGDLAGLKGLAAAQTALAAAEADPRLLPGALAVEGITAAAATLAEPGGVFGFLSGARRAAQAVAAQVAKDTAEPGPALAVAVAGQQARSALAAGEALGRGAFGALWGNAAGMAALLAWREAQGAAVWAALAAGAKPLDPAPVAVAVAAWAVLLEATGFVPEGAGEAPALPSFSALVEMLGAWATEPESLPLWQAWRRARAAAEDVADFAEALAAGTLAPEAAEDAFEHALLESLLAGAMRARPELAGFDGEAADRLVAEFREADRERVQLARAEAAFAHAEDVKKARAGLPGMEVLRGEMEKKRGHLPVRELLVRARSAVQAAKPVFLMSPLSVAQFLAPPHGLMPGLSFDLLVMDEASQIEPVDALGAIARARQVVVVGDDRQMPPTQFFQRMTGEDEEVPAEAGVAARDVESVLGLCNARGVPQAMLRWHYRSRHESLIAFSNAAFYGGRLCVLPSPKGRSASLGLSLVKVEVATKGAENTEAKAVAAAVIRHAKETPRETLGIAAFSMEHRDAIIDAVEAVRRENPETESFFSAHPDEPFFIKNLENVQGDERDAIFISVGFVREAGKTLRMNFGPVSAKGGERRLNVLITRAKRRCVVFSDIGAEDIDLERSDGVGGEAALKGFLAFAAGGAVPGAATAGEASPLAGLIGEAVEKAGKLAVKRVGLAGLFLDVAAKEGADFVLGVQADAGDWAALRCARDRERGRDTALSGMGWRLTRAWSLAWLTRPEAEAARIGALLGVAPAAAEAAVTAADPGLAAPYAEAVVEAPKDIAIPDVPFAKLAEIVAAIVTAEAPVHGDVVLDRVRGLWGKEALSAADQAAVGQAMKLGRQLQGLVEEGGFWRAEASVVKPRNRAAAAPLVRRISMVAPAEIEVAAVTLFTAVPVATEGELAAGLQRMLGLEASAVPALTARVAAMVGAGRIKLVG